MKVDKVKRRIIADELQFLNVQLVHIATQMGQLQRLQGEGLTDGEKSYLSHRYEALQTEIQKNHRLWERTHHTAGNR
jgi:hypothetical protein